MAGEIEGDAAVVTEVRHDQGPLGCVGAAAVDEEERVATPAPVDGPDRAGRPADVDLVHVDYQASRADRRVNPLVGGSERDPDVPRAGEPTGP